MARSRITSPSKDLIKDDGSVLFSVVMGEQLHFEITLNWITNLSTYTFFAKVVEADNDLTKKTIPTEPKLGGIVTTLPIIDTVTTDNKFTIVIPQTLIDSWTVKPKPGKPVYGFIDLQVEDNAIGNQEQVWKPLRGLIEVLYSPTEA